MILFPNDKIEIDINLSIVSSIGKALVFYSVDFDTQYPLSMNKIVSIDDNPKLLIQNDTEPDNEIMLRIDKIIVNLSVWDNNDRVSLLYHTDTDNIKFSSKEILTDIPFELYNRLYPSILV